MRVTGKMKIDSAIAPNYGVNYLEPVDLTDNRSKIKTANDYDTLSNAQMEDGSKTPKVTKRQTQY